MFLRSLLLSCCMLAALVSSAGATDAIRTASVPTLSVKTGGQGIVSFVVIQIAVQDRRDGPIVQFSEISLGGGSVVGAEWKSGVRKAAAAAARAVGTEGRDWVVTVRNRSYNSVTEGESASAVVAVGIMAAWRGDMVRPDAVMTGQIEPDGNILPVGRVPAKIDAAIKEGFRMILIPRGQLKTDEWDLTGLAEARSVDLLEVGSLEEAYQAMTAGNR
jgi:predicted S18 family serine protease